MTHPRRIQHGIEVQLREKSRAIEVENNALREMMRQDRVPEPDLADQACAASSQNWIMVRYNRNITLLRDISVALKAIDNAGPGRGPLSGPGAEGQPLPQDLSGQAGHRDRGQARLP